MNVMAIVDRAAARIDQIEEVGLDREGRAQVSLHVLDAVNEACRLWESQAAKDKAFAVVQKALDFDPRMKRVTLGKPDFDEHSKKKAAASPSITLVRHRVFMEGLMRVLTGRLTASDFVEWLAEPGVTDLGRLRGTPTYAEPAAV